MDEIPERSGRTASAIAGFLILAGTILVGVFLLAFLEIIDPYFLIENDYKPMFILFLLVLGIFDFVAGVILFR
ncbi:unnamed protein product [marine sediment metagenome]|uniref:Uncharacterized protein n=1 Tax=marine sediment metagenome TaxID=412755 RepID=X1CR87_9ZZZZ